MEVKSPLFRNLSLNCCNAAKSACTNVSAFYNSLHAALQHNEPLGLGYRQTLDFFTLTFWSLIMLTVEQVVASHKANIETLFGLTNKAFEGVEKIVELNLTASKAALSEVAGHTQSMLSVKDAQELLALQSGLFQPLAEKSAAYSRHLYDIASGAGAEFGKTFEGQAADAQKKFMGLVDSSAKNAPAGSEAAVAMMKSAVSAANNALESVQKAVKQATDVAEANFNAVAATATNAAKPTAKKR
jgi:phasin family protein